MAELRIYKVTQLVDGMGIEPRLIEAVNKVQAVNFVARTTIEAEVASQKDLVDLLPKGVKVEPARSAELDYDPPVPE